MSERSTNSSSNSSHNGQCATVDSVDPGGSSRNHNALKYKGKVAPERLNAYKVAFYGTAVEKESYRQQIRTKLKEQVQEKDELHRKQLVDRVAESDNAVAMDRQTKQEHNENNQKKAAYLKQFSNENKKIMEEKERSSRRTRQAETEHERYLLDVNPINWNNTLH